MGCHVETSIPQWRRTATRHMLMQEPIPHQKRGSFDLSRFDGKYFERLQRLLRAAARHGIVVELVFFCPFYKDAQWQLSPM